MPDKPADGRGEDQRRADHRPISQGTKQSFNNQRIPSHASARPTDPGDRVSLSQRSSASAAIASCRGTRFPEGRPLKLPTGGATAVLRRDGRFVGAPRKRVRVGWAPDRESTAHTPFPIGRHPYPQPGLIRTSRNAVTRGGRSCSTSRRKDVRTTARHAVCCTGWRLPCDLYLFCREASL